MSKFLSIPFAALAGLSLAAAVHAAAPAAQAGNAPATAAAQPATAKASPAAPAAAKAAPATAAPAAPAAAPSAQPAAVASGVVVSDAPKSSAGKGTACEEVKAAISAKLTAKGVKAFTLDAVPAADVKDAKVVGTCEGGAKKVTYKRG